MAWFNENSNIPVQKRTQSLAPRDNLFGLIDDFFKDWGSLNVTPGWSEKLGPALNVSESSNAYMVEAELPGVKKEDITLEFHDNVLTIKGEKKSFSEEKKEQYHRIERSHGSFSRSVRFPTDTDPEKVSAKMADGVLHVEVSKTTEAQRKKRSIAIT